MQRPANQQEVRDHPAPEDINPVVGRAPAKQEGDGNEPILRMLGKIHDQLEQTHRRQRQHDFSVLRLFGALLQMFAVVVALWGVAGLLDDQAVPATARFTLACFFQLASLSTFAIDRFR